MGVTVRAKSSPGKGGSIDDERSGDPVGSIVTSADSTRHSRATALGRGARGVPVEPFESRRIGNKPT